MKRSLGLQLLVVAVIGMALIAAWKLVGDAKANADSRGAGVPAGRGESDGHSATVARRSFRQTVRRIGKLFPVNEKHVFSLVGGVISEMAPQGKIVTGGEVVLRIDPNPHEELQATQEAAMAQEDATWKQQLASATKD